MRALRSAACLVPLAFAWALAGCADPPRAPGQADTSPDVPADAQLAWQGLLACADCGGIDTRLRLLRAGHATRYELVEAFLAEEGDVETFREEGHWLREGRLLRLRPDAGGERLYAIDTAGNLRVVDRRGRDAGAGRQLAPVAGAIAPEIPPREP